MRILVTGGAGFLGSHLVDRLLADGHEVIALDNLQTGARRNLAHLEREARFSLRFSFIEHDVTKPYDVGPVDRIYNLACAASPPRYQADPIHTTLTSVLGALHALEHARRHAHTVKTRVMQASTSEVYGDPDVHPQPESYRGNVNPLGPRACYDEGKRCAESLFMDHHRVHGTAVRIARIFNTYGPRMDLEDGRVVSTFIAQALRGEPLTIFGEGQQTRAFCYVDDLIDGFVRLMENEREIGPFNLGNPGEFTVRELAELVLEMTGAKSELVARPLPVDDPKQRRPVIDRARTELGFEPKVALREGLRRTIDEFRTRL